MHVLFLSLAKGQYRPSITAAFASIYCLLRVLVFVQNYYQELKIHKATQ